MQETPLDQLRSVILRQLNPLVNLLNIPQKEVEEAISRYYVRVKLIFEGNVHVYPPHCLFDWAIAAESGDKHSMSFLNFVEKEVSALLKIIEPKFQKAIKKTGKLMVLTLDDNPHLKNNPRYMNYLAELVGLNHILQQQHERFELLSIEKKLPNSKSADFEFLDKSNEDVVLIEFFSLHHIDPLKIESTEKFTEFLVSRFNAKLTSKTGNLNANLNRVELNDGSMPNFAILPILLCEVEPFLKFRKVFDDLNSKYINVLPFMSLLPQLDYDGTVYFSFAAVKHIFDRWELQLVGNGH